MALQDEIYAKIKQEIANDPEGVGYAGKTDDDIKTLLNSPVVKEQISYVTLPAPINRILSGIADTPNIVTTKDVTDSKTVTPK